MDGLICTSGFCAAKAPTAGEFRACALDVDCPAGDHCSLGACAHDCVADRDCTAGKTCDVRGRCVAQAMMAAPPPPTPPGPTSPVLAVDEAQLDFGTFTDTKTITVRNKGTASLDFRVLADQPWITATPVTGSVAPGAKASITLSVSSTGTGTRAGVEVVSTGGSAGVRVTVPAILAGLYQGEVHITDPADLGTRTFALVLQQDSTGKLTGVLDDARSPAYGFRAALADSSAVTGNNANFTLAIPARTGSGANPSYPQDLMRTVIVNATVGAAGKLAGSYTETIDGVFAKPAVLKGTIELAPVERGAQPLASQTDTINSATPATPNFQACMTCPSGPCPVDHVLAGRQFLEAAFPFYGTALADGSGDAYAPLRACVDNPAACYNPIALHCAQAHFYQAVAAGGPHMCLETGSGDCAQRGLLDTFKGLLAWDNIFANEHLVRAYQLDRPLAMQVTELSTAVDALVKGTLGDNTGGAKVRGILDPFFLKWIASLPTSTWASGQLSLLPEELIAPGRAPSSTVPAFGDFDHLESALALRIQALRDLLQAKHRVAAGSGTDLALEAGQSEVDMHITLALAASLLAQMGGQDRLASIVNGIGALTEKVREIGAGLNPVGFPDSYIAYTYNPALGATSNNYLDLMNDFRTNWLATASNAFTQAASSSRDFESTYQMLAVQLAAVNAEYGKQVADICGGSSAAPTTANCGQSSGQVFDTLQELNAAYLRLQNAGAALQNAYTAVEIEQNRAAQIANLHQATAYEIQADGTKSEALAQRQSDIEREEAAANAFAGLLTGGILMRPDIALQAFSSAFISESFADSKLEIEKEKIRLATSEKARVEFNAANETLIDSAARVRTQLLEIPTLNVNILLARDDIARSLGKLRSEMQQAFDAAANLKKMQSLSGQDPRRDPAYRAYRDENSRLAVKAFGDALRQLFLVTRAFEYEAGMSFGRRGDLWSLVTPDQMRSYAADIQTAYQQFTATVGSPQSRNITLSLRDQIFRFPDAIKDNVTGSQYQPPDVFHRLLADPRNRDSDGNVKLTFALSLAPDAFIFNQSLCTAKITGLRVSMVGATLGAKQPEVYLQQRGSAFLRSCSDHDMSGDYAVTEYNLENTIGVRRAVVQAGINLSGPMDATAGAMNTEFYGRPIASTYELIIDRNAPANAGLDLTKLDDIVLFIQHETRTVR
jgi:hypothetical protein